METHVPALIDVLLVATGSDGGVGGDARVDGVDVAERVDIGLEVRERLVRARLECGSVAAGVDVKGVYGSEDRV